MATDGGDAAEGRNEASHVSQRSKIAMYQTLEISNNAMREQIKFLTERIEKAQGELQSKEMLVEQIELEKRESYRKFEALENQVFELQEKLTFSQLETEKARMET